MGSPTCWPELRTTGTCTWWPGLRFVAMGCMKRRWRASAALKLNPANAPILYNRRARVYHYQNRIELAGDELEKGLALEPRHPLLRTSAGYQEMRLGHLDAAIEILEGVIRDDDSLRIAVPTLALCYVQAGARERAAALLKDDTLAGAEADSEMAYRLATYLRLKAIRARRCTGCGGRFIWGMRITRGSRRTRRGTTCGRTRTLSGFWRI